MKKKFLLFIVIISSSVFYSSKPKKILAGSYFAIEAKELPNINYFAEHGKYLSGKGKGFPRLDKDTIGSLGLALRYAQKNYWTSDKYSIRKYKVTRGYISDDQNKIPKLTAYRVLKPIRSRSHKFVASATDLFFKFNRKIATDIYTLEKLAYKTKDKKEIIFKNFKLVFKTGISSHSIKPGRYIRIKDIIPSSQRENKTYVFIEKSLVVNPKSSTSNGNLSTLLLNNGYAKAASIELDLSHFGRAKLNDYELNSSPGQRYGRNAKFHLFKNNDDSIDFAWKASKKRKIFLTKLNPDYKTQTTSMPYALDILGAITRDENYYYYVTISKGKNPRMVLVKANYQGKLIRKKNLSNQKKQFNVFVFNDNVMSLRVANGRIGLVMGRTMQKSHDGLNHQGSIAATFNAKNLNLVKNFGQNSGHSFDNRVIFDGSNFISTDLGDNYPRGIIIHKYFNKMKGGKVVFTFKTAHGRRSSPYRKDKYGRSLRAGRWSNDNQTYTELSEIIKQPKGYMVFFTSETSINNRIAQKALNESRNFGYVLVDKNFETKKQRGNVVTTDIVISKGKSSREFGFYTFDGNYSKQKNVGVKWLTHYRNHYRATVERPKVVMIDRYKLLLLWEKWDNKKYISSYGQYMSLKGKKIGQELKLGSKIRFLRGEKILHNRNKLFWVLSRNGQFELQVLRLN